MAAHTTDSLEVFTNVDGNGGSRIGEGDPSNSEDTFLMPDEMTNLHSTKCMHHLNALRTTRIRALSPAPCLDSDNADLWGGNNEEPDTAQAELIHWMAAQVVCRMNNGHGLPVPATGVWVSTGQGTGSHDFGGFENLQRVFEPIAVHREPVAVRRKPVTTRRELAG
ncbi:hypothetical protein EDB83DRAFT_2529730 [Lactarius deliciosus]|nr:hypothetical protein EDB83DRAFT_2529730 [Lactarius deliciosus]